MMLNSGLGVTGVLAHRQLFLLAFDKLTNALPIGISSQKPQTLFLY